MFWTNGQILEAVANTLKKDVGDLESYWEGVVEQAHLAAYQQIVGDLLERGFTKVQVDAWDRGPEFEKHLALFWALTDGGALEGFSDIFIRTLDRRKDLKTVQVFVSGAYVVPLTGAAGPGTVGTGGPSDNPCGLSMFNWDAEDPRLGQPTRW